MHEIVLDLTKFKPATLDALRDRAIREGKPLKTLLSELIEKKTETILSHVEEPKADVPQ